MAPSGAPLHQRMLTFLWHLLEQNLAEKGYLVLADEDVSFGTEGSYLRPDVSVLRPDADVDLMSAPIGVTPVLVVEILSPSTASNDLGPKRDIYAASGVAEYWVADPVTGSLMIFERRQDGAYRQIGADAQGRVRSPMLDKTFRISRDGHSYKIVE